MSDLTTTNASYLNRPATAAPRNNNGAGFAGTLGQVAARTGELVASATPSAPGQAGQVDQMWAMQRESQTFNLQYLALQEAIQADNRNFTTLSNLLKAQHDTARSAIQNIRA